MSKDNSTTGSFHHKCRILQNNRLCFPLFIPRAGAIEAFPFSKREHRPRTSCRGFVESWETAALPVSPKTPSFSAWLLLHFLLFFTQPWLTCPSHHREQGIRGNRLRLR